MKWWIRALGPFIVKRNVIRLVYYILRVSVFTIFFLVFDTLKYEVATDTIWTDNSFESSWTWSLMYFRKASDFHRPCSIIMWSLRPAKWSCMAKLVRME